MTIKLGDKKPSTHLWAIHGTNFVQCVCGQRWYKERKEPMNECSDKRKEAK